MSPRLSDREIKSARPSRFRSHGSDTKVVDGRDLKRGKESIGGALQSRQDDGLDEGRVRPRLGIGLTDLVGGFQNIAHGNAPPLPRQFVAAPWPSKPFQNVGPHEFL